MTLPASGQAADASANSDSAASSSVDSSDAPVKQQLLRVACTGVLAAECGMRLQVVVLRTLAMRWPCRRWPSCCARHARACWRRRVQHAARACRPWCCARWRCSYATSATLRYPAKCSRCLECVELVARIGKAAKRSNDQGVNKDVFPGAVVPAPIAPGESTGWNTLALLSLVLLQLAKSAPAVWSRIWFPPVTRDVHVA